MTQQRHHGVGVFVSGCWSGILLFVWAIRMESIVQACADAAVLATRFCGLAAVQRTLHDVGKWLAVLLGCTHTPIPSAPKSALRPLLRWNPP
jgi:hypothetical protein